MTTTFDPTTATSSRPGTEPPRPLLDPIRLASLITGLRWGSIAVGLALGGAQITRPTSSILLWAALLSVHAWIATVGSWWRRGGVAPLAVDVLVATVAVAATGAWGSPFIFCVFVVVVEAGATSGLVTALGTAALSVGLVTVGQRLLDTGVGLRVGAQWALELVMVAMLASFTRTVSIEAARQRVLALDRLSQLAEANALLSSLQRVAQQLPASLDLAAVLDDAMARMSDLIGFDRGSIVLFDETIGRWDVARARGVKAVGPYEQAGLPEVLATAAAASRLVHRPHLDGGGLHPASAEGVYAPIRARGTLVGVLAFEFDRHPEGIDRITESIEAVVEPLGLAVDNARLFGRLRTLGADEERIRIARDLHDRIGQSLSYLAFELDRLVAHTGDADTRRRLEHLRIDVRSVIGEVRDTLYDLRTDLPAEGDPSGAMRSFLDRVKERTGLVTWLDVHVTGRLALPLEQELWRIAKEAITNVERHAHAKRLVVRWACDGATASVEVTDDGVGFTPEESGRPDSFGLLGMRERAAGIGAHLDISSQPGGGTTIRAVLLPH